MIQTALAFIKKDFLITVSYRFDLVIQIIIILVLVTTFYILGKFVDSTSLPFLKPYGGSYFGFLMIGIAFAGYAGISINSFSRNIREGQLTGTLEIILASPTPLLLFLFSSSLWNYIFTTIRLFVYFLMGICVFELEIGRVNLLAAVIIFTLSIITFMAIGFIFASLVIVVKRGEAAFNAAGGIFMIISGLFFPTELLPSLLRIISLFIPFTYTFHGLRLSIIEGHSIAQLKEDVAALFVFATVFMVISLILFPYAVKKAKEKGSLAQY